MSNIICCKCGYNNHLENASFCQNCGLELENFCPNSDCEVNKKTIGSQTIPLDAKYCPYCGSKSTYFDYLDKSEN